MVRCPQCDVESSPGPACASCGAPLPPPAARPAGAATPEAPAPARWLSATLLAVGAFVALAGVAFLSFTWPFVYGPHLLFFLAGGMGIASGWGVRQGHTWGWGVAWAVVTLGAVYALWGLSRGYGSGVLGLALWGGAAAGLMMPDVRRHCAVGW